jgi:hypothetical protein
MSTFYYTNRRRAKDAVMTLYDISRESEMMVFVRDSLVYVDIKESNGNQLSPEVVAVLHYAEQTMEPIEELLQLDRITELYRGDGITRLRV